ncbi:cytochrome P450 [Melanogaster broomeanus]|nr:cytochrome P450 [Melanogaster broomeanus]
MLTSITWLDLCLAGVGLYFIKQVTTKRNPAPFPPGPKGLPLVGNLADMPSVKPWLTFTEWGQKYGKSPSFKCYDHLFLSPPSFNFAGDISHIEILGQHIVVLNNVNTAMEMLDKKSSAYSDRPIFPMGGELVGWENTLVLLPYGNHFREYRKNFARVIGSRSAMHAFHPIEESETHHFLQRILAKPAELSQHVKENHDPFVDLADEAVDQFSAPQLPELSWSTSSQLVLKHVPDWFPGAGFKLKAKEWRATLEDMVQKPYQFVKDQMVSSYNDEQVGLCPEEEDHIVKWSSASLYSGGADTTVSAIYSLFLALTLYPDALKKAQAEIDAVIGSDRLPTFADRDSLPYVEALAKEVLRWHSVTPLGIPHRATEDDIQGGYYIPKGSLILPNIWFMLHDPRTYTNPNEFNPERFLAREGKEPEADPRTTCFGFGRRICPGMHLADASVWISVAMSVAVFDVSKIVENGVEITPEVDPSSGTISHPKPFKCSIKPRSAKALELIQQDPVH